MVVQFEAFGKQVSFSGDYPAFFHPNATLKISSGNTSVDIQFSLDAKTLQVSHEELFKNTGKARRFRITVEEVTPAADHIQSPTQKGGR